MIPPEVEKQLASVSGAGFTFGPCHMKGYNRVDEEKDIETETEHPTQMKKDKFERQREIGNVPAAAARCEECRGQQPATQSDLLHGWQGPGPSSHHLLPSKVYYQGAGLEVNNSELKWTLQYVMWHHMWLLRVPITGQMLL